MFSGYSEVMAYVQEEAPVEVGIPVVLIDDLEHDFIRAEVLPSTSALGGFKMGPFLKYDFILIAECSEISGPNPIYTIPKKQRIVNDLNTLCVRILSADYQEFSCNKCVTNNHTQVLMPDIMTDVHVAINHFTLYDSEARGFVRPLCIAYVTTDKHKLVQMSDRIFKYLSEASSFIQHVNRKYCQEGFLHLEMDLQLTKSNLSLCEGLQNVCDNPQERLKVYNNLIDSCIAAVLQILESIKEPEPTYAAKLIEDFTQQLSHKLGHDSLLSPVDGPKSADYEPKLLKVPIQQNFDKRLRSLFTISPHGSVLALYHLHLTHKHYRRKYENILLSDQTRSNEYLDDGLRYGACLKLITCAKDVQEEKKCCLRVDSKPISLDYLNEQYLLQLDEDYFDILFDFLSSQNISLSNGADSTTEPETTSNDAVECSEVSIEQDRSDKSMEDLTKSSNSSSASIKGDPAAVPQCNRHIVTLGGIWEVIDHLRFRFPDIEAVTLKVLRSLNVTENVFLSLLSRTLLVILYSIEEEFFIRIFIQVLAAIVPRDSKQEISVVHHRGRPLRKTDFTNTAIVTYSMPCELSDLIPAEIMESTSILDLTTLTYSGPKYIGCLLDGINDRVKMMSPEDPVLPFLISVLGDVELQVKLWQSVVKSSATNDFSTMYLLQKGYTRYDIRIVEALSRLSNS